MDDATVNSAAVLVGLVATAALLITPRIGGSRMWRAMITPLASIIGSGFLVLGPILMHGYGSWAPAVMAGLCALAYAYGSVMRFNIDHAEGHQDDMPVLRALETLASALLAFAYVISVAYYLNLFGAFAVSQTGLTDHFHARLVTTAMLAFIAVLGFTHGLHGLERSEMIAVGIKLAIIAGLLLGFFVYFGESAVDKALHVAPPQLAPWPALTLAFGLIVTVQGFETSRYLGADYAPEMRKISMRRAQLLSTLIYVTYTALIAFSFLPGDLERRETAIIDLTAIVAPILPALLVLAALAAQLSAAIADTGGAGGLVQELSRGRIPARLAYVILVTLALGLTWSADVFAIISYASRAFAAYYGVQAAIAAYLARRNRRAPLVQAGFAALVIVAALIVAFGTPAEGDPG